MKNTCRLNRGILQLKKNSKLILPLIFIIGILPVALNAQNYVQVLNTSGTSVVDGITATVTSSGDVSNFSPCGSSTGPYFVGASGLAGSYTFTFSAPVGSVKVNVVFAGGGTAGQVHFIRNGTAYAIADANLAGTVGGCAVGVLAVASGGDLTNAGNLASNPNNSVIIPGPVTSLTVSSLATNGAIFGLFITPSTYFQVANTSGSSVVNGVTTTVTSGGTASSFSPCGAAVGPYFLQGSGDVFNYSFSPAVDGVNVPVVYASGGVAGTTHFTVNGSAVSLTNGNLAGAAPSGCSPGLLAVVAGGNLTNNGNLSASPNATVMLPNSGTITTLNVASLAAAASVNGLFITKGSTAALTYTNTSNQSLALCTNASALSINSLLAVNELNSGLTLTWTVAVNPLHGTLVLGTTQTSTGGIATPTGFTYQPTASYTGPDGFTFLVSDGINSASTTVNINVTNPPNVSSFTPSASTNIQGTGNIVTITSSSLGNGTFTVNYSLTGANIAGPNNATLIMNSGTGTFTTSPLINSGLTTITINSVSTGCPAILSSGNTTVATTSPSTTSTGLQVLNTSGTSVVDGITATVTSSGDVSNFSPCGSSTGPYFVGASGLAGSYTFTFSAPVGSVKVNVVFAGGGTAGQVHFVRNGTAYAIADANLAGTVGGCAVGVLAVASGGDLTNAGNLASNPNNSVIIPGPVTSLTVSSLATNGAIFGLFITPSTYFQVANTSGSSVVNGVTTTVTSGGTASSFSPCGAAVGPYFLQGSGDVFNYSFSPAVDGVNVPVVYASGGVAGTTHFTVNGSAVSLTNGNLAGAAPSGCSPGLLAVVAGGNLTNNGNLSASPNATVMLPNSGTITTLNVASLAAAASVNGLFITKGSTAALTYTNTSNQSLALCTNASALSINSLLAVNELNSGLTLTWTVAVNPLHGTLVLGTTQTSTGGIATPTGFTYQPTASYTGPDGFTFLVSDGINTVATTIIVTVNLLATVNAGTGQTICAGNTATMNGSFGGAASSATWSTNGTGSFNNNSGTAVYTPGATDIAAGSVILTYLTNDPAGSCGPVSADMNLIITPSSGILAGTAGGVQVCKTMNVGTPATYTDASCNTIVKIVPANIGASTAVSGSISSCVKIENTIPVYNSKYYVARHYDVVPAIAPATSSGNVTLYFTPAEMLAFNTNPSAIVFHYPLPVNNGDITDSVRIEQYHGTGTDPTNYSGSLQTWSKANGLIVTYNTTTNLWEITVPATSFSGFWLTSKLRAVPLPITIEYFQGTNQGDNHVLDWKVNCTNTQFATLTLEFSSDGRSFTILNSTRETAQRCLQSFSYTNAHPLNGITYYRLKMTDDYGVITYSSMVALRNRSKGLDLVNIVPNPVLNGVFKLNISSSESVKMEITVMDISGRVVAKQPANIIQGFNSVDVNVSKLAAGTYQVYGTTTYGRTRTLSLLIQ